MRAGQLVISGQRARDFPNGRLRGLPIQRCRQTKVPAAALVGGVAQASQTGHAGARSYWTRALQLGSSGGSWQPVFEVWWRPGGSAAGQSEDGVDL